MTEFPLQGMDWTDEARARLEPVFTQRRIVSSQPLVRQTPFAIPACVLLPPQPHRHFFRDLMASA